MAFQIVRNDLTTIHADAIVNTANPEPLVGSGVDFAIHTAAGPELLKARQAIGRIRIGQSAITPAYGLPARFVVHTAGPRWEGGQNNEAGLLRSCYDSALTLAWQNGCRSIAFPLISAGNYGFPRELALDIATQAFRQFLKIWDMEIQLVVFDKESFRISRSLFDSVASFIDETYVERSRDWEYSGGLRNRGLPGELCRDEICSAAPLAAMEDAPRKQDVFSLPHLRDTQAVPPSLSQLLEQMDAGFSETLL